MSVSVFQFAVELEQRLHEQRRTDPSAAELASLFLRTFETGPKERALLHALQKHLLKRTMEHATARSPFYATPAYAEFIRTPPGEPADLSCWPIISRQDIVEHFDDFIAEGLSFTGACHTSGCTGPSLSIYKSAEELAFLWSYYERLMEPAVKRLERRPLILSMPNLYHGTPVRLPSIGKVFVSGVTDDLLINDAVKVLQKTYRISGHDPRISIISALAFQMVFFTNFLLEQGHDPRRYGITSISVVGNYVSQGSLRFLAESWGATIFDRFTLTESSGGASRCHACGHFHLDPHVIGEVVDPVTGKALEEGVGNLTLTQLHPFVQMQPLIRYSTGDLVRKLQSDCSNTLTFDFLGKTSNCISWQPDGKGTEWLLFSTDLYEIINELPDVRSLNQFINVRSVKDTSLGSPLIFSQKTSPPEAKPFVIELVFELRYTPHYHQRRADELRARIHDGLSSASTALSRRLAEGTVALDIRFVGPGSLGDRYFMKV